MSSEYYRREEELKSKFRFKGVVDLDEAARICLISKERLSDLAKSGFVPCLFVDQKHYWFKRKDIFEWAKENLVVQQPGVTIPKYISIIEHKKCDPFGIPEKLISVSDKLKEFNEDGFGTCIYFLILNKEVVYVGQSTSLPSRISTHKTTKKFDRVLYLPCPRDNLNDVEASLIRALKPLYNVSHSGCELLEFHKTNLNKIGFASMENVNEC